MAGHSEQEAFRTSLAQVDEQVWRSVRRFAAEVTPAFTHH